MVTIHPDPDKPEPKLTAKTKKETKYRLNMELRNSQR
jgi:hypothetical protein